MKKFAIIILAMVLGAASCTKPYEEVYDSLYYTNPYTGVVTSHMFTSYDLGAIGDAVALVVYYSGSWTASLPDDCDWAYLTRTAYTGVKTMHFVYSTNDGPARETVLTITADNGETLDITFSQSSK